MKTTGKIIRCSLLSMTAITFIIAMLVFLPGKGSVYAQDSRKAGMESVPGNDRNPAGNKAEVNPDDLCSINAIKRYLARNLRYPSAAAETGETGTIELYARINNQGRVNEVLELQPVRDYLEVDEIVVVGYAPAGKELNESSRHESLIAESRRVVMSMPRCDIQEIYGRTLKLTIKFVLQ